MQNQHHIFNATDIEKENLTSHVELSVLRYQNLEYRLGIIESTLESLSAKIQDGQYSMSKVIIGSTTTIIAGLLSLVVTILMKF